MGEARCMFHTGLYRLEFSSSLVLGEYFDKTLILANGLGTSNNFIITWLLVRADKHTSIYMRFLQIVQ